MKKLFYHLSVVALLVLTACGGATFITPDKESVNFTIEGGEDMVNIDADGSWDIAECPDWVTADAQNNILVIKTSKNESGAIRKGDIVLQGKEGVSATIKVTQVTKCTHITPDSDNVEFEKEGGTKTVNIDTDGMLQVEAPEGFTATFDNGVLTINAPANEEGAKNGEIKLTGDGQSATITLNQKGNICPKCNGTGKVRCSRCGGSGYTIDGPHSVAGCRSCGGRGYQGNDPEYDDYSGDIISHYWSDNYRQGSGKVNCPQCGGRGY